MRWLTWTIIYRHPGIKYGVYAALLEGYQDIHISILFYQEDGVAVFKENWTMNHSLGGVSPRYKIWMYTMSRSFLIKHTLGFFVNTTLEYSLWITITRPRESGDHILNIN